MIVYCYLHDEIENNIKIYPNPAKDLITIKGIEKVSSAHIYTLTGRYMKSNRNPNTIDVSDLSPGTYTLLIELPEGRLIRKGVVKWYTAFNTATRFLKASVLFWISRNYLVRSYAVLRPPWGSLNSIFLLTRS